MGSPSSPVGELAMAHFGESAELIWRVDRGGGLQDFLQAVSEVASTSVCALTPEAGPSQPMSRGAGLGLAGAPARRAITDGARQCGELFP
jgi:hypothetical protein